MPPIATTRFGVDVAVISTLGAAAVRALGATWRMDLVGEEHEEAEAVAAAAG